MVTTNVAETEQLAAGVRATLVEHADTAYRKKIAKLVPTEIEIIGVRVPVIRALVKSFRNEHPEITVDAMMVLLDHAFAERCREELLFATILLASRRKQLAGIEWARVERWVDGIEDWEVCDQLAMGVIGELVAREPAHVETLVDWSKSDNRWRRRAALAASTSLNQKGRKDAGAALRICEPVMADDDKMIEKALGWALREASKSDAAAVAKFLMSWKGRANRRVLREGSEKLDDAARAELLD